MKFIQKILLVTMMMFGLSSQSQNKKDVKELKALGREQLIEYAEKIIKKDHPEFASTNFDQITVMGNNSSVYLTFDMSFKYVPLYSSYYYGIYIDLAQNMTSKGALSNFDTEHNLDKIEFFTPNDESKKAIEFVIEAVNKSDEVGTITNGKLDAGNSMTIYEKEDYYQITVDSYSTTSNYKIKKETGEVYNTAHKHKVIDSREDEGFKEIK